MEIIKIQELKFKWAGQQENLLDIQDLTIRKGERLFLKGASGSGKSSLLGLLPASLGMPISAGSLFTGFFNPDNLDPTDPEAAIEFGTPFTGRPVKMRLKYQYEPGEENQDKDGNALSYPDMLDIYAFLEIRLGGATERLTTAWFRSGDAVESLTTVDIPFYYGELDSSFPDYMKPPDNVYVSADSATFALPTHITFVASSSFDGANFAGAVGSILIVDDVEMVYDE